MQIDWLGILGKVAELVLVPLISSAILYFISWLKVKKQELAEKVKDENTRKYLDLLDNTIRDCVLATNQTYVAALKKAGTFDEEAHKKAFQLTYDAVTAILTEDAHKYLDVAIKDLNNYITTKIEAQVGLNHS